MKRISGWLDKNRGRMWFSLVLNLMVLLFLALLMRPVFESNDDITMMEFVNGAKGVREAHIVFQHYFLGVLYTALYGILPGIPWYALAQYFVLWLSFSAITYVLLNRWKQGRGVFLALLILLYFAQECYIHIQFTKTGGIASAAAVFLLLYAVDKEKVGWKALIAGELLGALGSMFRFRQFFACAVLLGGIGLYFLLQLRQNYAGRCLRRLLVYAGTFGGLVVFVLLLHVIDLRVYSADPQWSGYVEYNRSRAQLTDLGFPDYDAFEETYASLGLTYDAYWLYTSLDLNDPEIFPVEVMQELARVRPRHQGFSRALVELFLNEVPIRYFDTPVFYCFFLLFFLWLIFGEHNWRAFLAVLSEFVIFGLVYFYMYYTGRYLINRVDVGLWFAICLAIAWFIPAAGEKLSPGVCIAFLLLVFIVQQQNWMGDWRTRQADKLEEQQKSREMLEAAGNDKEHLYLSKMINGLSGNDSYGPFDRMPVGIMDNICWFGGWETNTVLCKDILSRYGVENPYRDMIDNEKIYLVDNNINLTLRYLQTYYDKDVTATEAGKIGDRTVYRIGGSNGSTGLEG